MELIGLEDHRIFIFHSDHHCHVIEVTVGKNSLNFGSEMLGVEEKDVSCLCCFEELFLGEYVFVEVGLFGHGFEHEFLVGLLVVEYV